MRKLPCRLVILLLLQLIAWVLPAGAESTPPARSEGLREQWGELYFIFSEPVVSRTAVENGRRLGREGEKVNPADCGLELFTVSGSPAPKLRWHDQNRLRIEFAPGSSPETEYRLSFKPGTTYLGGAPLATPEFSFRCKPVELAANWLEDFAGGAALLSAAGRDTHEIRQLATRHECLRVSFRRMRYIPLMGWVCSGTVPAQLRVATLADGIGKRRDIFEALLDSQKPEDIRLDTPLPKCLLALPQVPLTPGVRYDIDISAAPGSGFASVTRRMSELPEALTATLERELAESEPATRARETPAPGSEQAGAPPCNTRLKLSFSHPVSKDVLQELWGRLGVRVNGQLAQRAEDGSYQAESNGQTITLRLQELLPCNSQTHCWRSGVEYHYCPADCAQGLEIVADATQPAEVQLTLPADLRAQHGLAMAGEQVLGASLSPACPELRGNGTNLVAWSGEHRLRLPLINTGQVTATAYHWEATAAARLLPVIQHGMRDDTLFCELYPRLGWMRRRAKEGLSTAGWLGEDARNEAGRALHLLQRERQKSDPLRAQALAEATAYPPQRLTTCSTGNKLLSRGEAQLDLDQLTGGQLRPGLYLISVTSEPSPGVQQALASFGMDEQERAIPCTVDYLVLVTDMSLRWGKDRLLVNSLANGQPLEGGQLSFCKLPAPAPAEADADTQLTAARAEATAMTDLPAIPLQQGEIRLPAGAGEKLMLLQRGEDYTLFSLWDEKVPSPAWAGRQKAVVELFCDRPLYRPGDTVHLRGVLRRPTESGIALPSARQATLTISKPNGEVMERCLPELDAYGALSADFTLPQGEEDVAGDYRCRLMVAEGNDVLRTELNIPCEVFRRDAFEATLSLELDPVAPTGYRANVQATDYNGSPVAGGRVKLFIESTAHLQDSEGNRSRSLPSDDDTHLHTCELQLDAAGRASHSGRLAPFEKEGRLRAWGTVSNDREEHVQLTTRQTTLAPADFLIRIDSARRLHLIDARSGGNGRADKPLPRAQEIELRVLVDEEKRRELPSGICCEQQQQRELARQRITVPAHCTEGIALHPLLEKLEEQRAGITLQLSGKDAEGRHITHEHKLYFYGPEEETSLVAEGRNLRLSTSTPYSESGQLHACISSQGKLRHTLVPVEAGASSVLIPLSEQEYGDISITLISCGKDRWGTCTQWRETSGHCTLPRPDKKLTITFNLPESAKPGQQVCLRGQVSDAGGKGARAAVTLFAVDAGMMSVAPYTLPELATSFYKGRAEHFYLFSRGQAGKPVQSGIRELPNLWSTAGSEWEDGPAAARYRSVWPACLETGALRQGTAAPYRWRLEEVVRAAQPDFRWSKLFGMGEVQAASYESFEGTPAPMPVVTLQKAAKGSIGGRNAADDNDSAAEEEATESSGPPDVRLRRNFEPVALWLASVETAEDGSFAADSTLPDTLTTYGVYAVALGADGESFGKGESSFRVNQKLMLTAGTPFFMSCGDKLLLPLTITNNGDEAGEWEVCLSTPEESGESPLRPIGAGEQALKHVKLAARSTTTLHVEIEAQQEGTGRLRWTALSCSSTPDSDAVENNFPVRYPAPLLKETHRLVLSAGAEGGSASINTAELMAEEIASSTRGSLSVQYSTSPLLHLAGGIDFLLTYPYGCTEQRASALLPWLFYNNLAPFCPHMAQTPAESVHKTVQQAIEHILARQQEDGGLSYWAAGRNQRAPSCDWASAYAGLVLTIAREQGIAVPEQALEKLRHYLGRQRWKEHDYLTQYAAARTRGREGEINRILVKALRQELKDADMGMRKGVANLEFIAELRSNPGGRHEALLRWFRSQARDYRHRSSWSGGWTLIALSEYLRLEPGNTGSGSVRINGEEKQASAQPGEITLLATEGRTLADIAPRAEAGSGTTYLRLAAKAQPEQTNYPGVTEKGLQITRLYEVQGENGQWQPATEFKVGDIVRITLTCAKIADELEYLVLEDYLPSCMEAINPNVPSQAAGLEDGGRGSWSRWIDHKEYLADRVRGFCTRWAGRDLVNMSYYARVKRAGESTAPPAEAQLMYEPQIYGLSPNTRVRSE